MRKPVENNNELLKKLVLSGDSRAFLALTLPYFKGRYLRVRSGGTAMPDAQKMVLDEAVELLEGVQHVSLKQFDTWFEEHCSLLPGTEPAGDPGGLVDVKLLTETESFIDRCSRVLLRTGSDLKRQATLRRKTFPHSLLQHQSVIWFLAGIAILLFGAGATLLMVKTHTALQVHLLVSGNRTSFQFPPDRWVLQDTTMASTPETHLPAVDSTTLKGDTLQASIQKETSSGTLLKKEPPAERVADPVVQSTPPPRRSLPPIVPKARLILPPPPPPPVEPVYPAYQETNLYGQQPATAAPEPSTPSDSESTY